MVHVSVFKCSMESPDIGGLGELSFAQKYYHLGREINDLVTENRYFRDPHVFDSKLTTEFWVS